MDDKQTLKGAWLCHIPVLNYEDPICEAVSRVDRRKQIYLFSPPNMLAEISFF